MRYYNRYLLLEEEGRGGRRGGEKKVIKEGAVYAQGKCINQLTKPRDDVENVTYIYRHTFIMVKKFNDLLQ